MKALHRSNCSSLKQVQLILRAIEVKQQEMDKEVYLSAGVGKHIRHIVDHYLALKNGLGAKSVDYNQRNRESEIERNLSLALEQIQQVISWISLMGDDNDILEVCSEIDCDESINEKFNSNKDRELLYLINHTIHHTAYIKLLLKNYGIKLSDEIGIAPCTASHLREQSLVLG